jgi:hypothetical protein
MAAASRREFDLVLFWSLDRFSREGVLATLQCLQRLTPYGVGWRSFTEQYLVTASSGMRCSRYSPPSQRKSVSGFRSASRRAWRARGGMAASVAARGLL